MESATRGHSVRRMQAPLALFVIALAVLGIAQRGFNAVEMPHDAAHYLALARSLWRGEGMMSTAHWALNLPREALPFPDTYRAPLFPTLAAAAYWLTPTFFAAGKWVSVVAGACIPPLAPSHLRSSGSRRW